MGWGACQACYSMPYDKQGRPCSLSERCAQSMGSKQNSLKVSLTLPGCANCRCQGKQLQALAVELATHVPLSKTCAICVRACLQ